MQAANAQELLAYLQSKTLTEDTPIEIRVSFAAGMGDRAQYASYEIEDYETMDDGTIVLHA